MVQSMTSVAGPSKKRKTAPDSDPGTPSPKKKRASAGRATARKSTGGRPPNVPARGAAGAGQHEPGAFLSFPLPFLSWCTLWNIEHCFTEIQVVVLLLLLL